MTSILPNLTDLPRPGRRRGRRPFPPPSRPRWAGAQKDGRLDREALDDEQHAAHGLAWTAAYAETLRQTAAWAWALEAEGRFGEAEALPAQLLAHRGLSRSRGGNLMNQGEFFRPADVFAPAERLSQGAGLAAGRKRLQAEVADRRSADACGRPSPRPAAWTRRWRRCATSSAPSRPRRSPRPRLAPGDELIPPSQLKEQ